MNENRLAVEVGTSLILLVLFLVGLLVAVPGLVVQESEIVEIKEREELYYRHLYTCIGGLMRI